MPGPGGVRGCLLQGDAWSRGVPAPRGSGPVVPGVDPPPRWLLLRTVRILLECILV